VQQEVARLAASPEVRSAFNWLRTQEPQLAQWQMEMARIAAASVWRDGTRGVAGGALFAKSGWMMFRIDDVVTCLGSILDLGSGTWL